MLSIKVLMLLEVMSTISQKQKYKMYYQDIASETIHPLLNVLKPKLLTRQITTIKHLILNYLKTNLSNA